MYSAMVYLTCDRESCPLFFFVTHRTTLPRLRTNHCRAKHRATVSIETNHTNIREHALCNPVAHAPVGSASESYASYYWVRGRRKLITTVHMTSVNGMTTQEDYNDGRRRLLEREIAYWTECFC
jgi:hypothetical protein